MKEYKYKFSIFLVSSLGPVILMIGLMLWGIIGTIKDPSNNLYRLASWVTPILLVSSLVALNQPDRITDDGETITFYGFGRQHAYGWK